MICARHECVYILISSYRKWSFIEFRSLVVIKASLFLCLSSYLRYYHCTKDMIYTFLFAVCVHSQKRIYNINWCVSIVLLDVALSFVVHLLFSFSQCVNCCCCCCWCALVCDSKLNETSSGKLWNSNQRKMD